MTREVVLVVDDHPPNLVLLEHLLVEAEFEVRTAVDAPTALAAIAAEVPRLILMDLQLPGMDGFALTRKLKDDPATRHILIVAVTSYAMSGDDQRAREAGCDGYLAKPIDTTKFADQIRAYLLPQRETG